MMQYLLRSTSVLAICLNIIFIFLISATQLLAAKDTNKVLYLNGPNGTTVLKVGADDDGDSIANELEVNGFTYSITDGLQAWDGDSSKTWFKTDPLRWSTDGDPYSDYMEVTGINMPAAISAPENHPLVAARPVITIRMEDYDVIPLAEISDSQGGEESSSFTNEVSNSDEVSASVTVEASLNPFKLVGGSATASYSHTWTTTNSSTSSFGSNWNNTRTTNPAQAARLKLRIYMLNKGGATALDVAPTVNLKLGQKTISTFIPAQMANILTPPGTSDNRFPKNGTILVEKDENANDIIITLDELKAIQMGTPLSLEVVQVSAKVVRWNSTDQDWNSDIEWASFESEINPVSVEVLAELGSGTNYRYEVFAGTPYWDPQFNLDHILSLIFEKSELGGVTYIEGRKYPDDWYLSSPSQEVINEWNNAGQPANMLNLRMQRNTRLVMMSPGVEPKPTVNLASYSADYKNILISARPNNFPILTVEAEIPVNGKTEKYTLIQGPNSFYILDKELSALPDGPGTVTVTNARGDKTTATIILPAVYANARDVKDFSAFLPNPGSDYWLYQNGDETKPMLLYCLFYDPETGAELATPKEYLTVPASTKPQVYSDFNAYSDQYRFYFDKIRIDPSALQMDLSDASFISSETIIGTGEPPSWLLEYTILGRASWAYPEIDSAEAQIDLSGSPFRLSPEVNISWNIDGTILIDRKRQKLTIKRKNLAAVSNEYYGYGGFNDQTVQLQYGYQPVPTGQGLLDNGQAVALNAQNEDGYINMFGDESLRLTGDCTLEAWIFPTGPGTYAKWGGIILNREGEYEIARLQDGTICWALANSSPGWAWQNTYFYAPEQQWLHLAVVYGQEQVKIYFNGQLFSTQPATGVIGDKEANLDHFMLGSRQNSNNQRFQGLIDEVRIWNRARSAAQIKHTFNDTLNADYYATSDSGLVGYWRFDTAEDTGEGVLVSEDLSVNDNGGWLYGDVELSVVPTALEGKANGPARNFALNQNYPNPFNPVTTIHYKIVKSARVELSVYNTAGQKIKTLSNIHQNAGSYTLYWDGRNGFGQQVASGLYIYRLSLDGVPVQSRKMILTR